jgi:argonaute-like protein implicated in RNA metabolism and viral defense
MGTRDLEVVGMVTPVFAHMGGIDEIGVFLIPALLAIYVLRRAERQARKREAESADQPVTVKDGSEPEAGPPI